MICPRSLVLGATPPYKRPPLLKWPGSTHERRFCARSKKRIIASRRALVNFSPFLALAPEFATQTRGTNSTGSTMPERAVSQPDECATIGRQSTATSDASRYDEGLAQGSPAIRGATRIHSYS